MLGDVPPQLLCTDDETIVAFVDFIHLHGTKIMWEAKGASVPEVYVSHMDGARRHIVRTGSAVDKSRT